MNPASPATSDKIDAAVLKIAGVVVLGAIMATLDITVVNVALPTFQQEFAGAGESELPLSTVAWTVTAYTLALAAVIPMSGWAADRFGPKRLYMIALALFTVGSILCAAATSIEMLIAFRVLQGLGGGMLMPVGLAIMTRAAGPRRMGRLMAILGIPMLLGPIGGPILGGWLIDHHSWQWIFLINGPIGLIALVYAWFVLPKDEAEPSESFDIVGMALMAPGLALFLYGVSSIPEEGGFGATKVWLTMLIGAMLIGGFIAWSFRPQHPLLDLRLFQNRNLTVAVITMFLFAVAFFGGMLLLPTYFQNIRGEGAFDAGLMIAPQGLGAVLTMPIAGYLVDKFPVGRIVPVGVAIITGAMFSLASIGADTSYTRLIITFVVLGLGMGMTMMPLMTSALRTLRNHEVARGSTIMNIVQQVASSVGVAVMSVLMTNGLNNSTPVQTPDGEAPIGQLAIGSVHDPELAAQLPPDVQASGLTEAANVFGQTFLVASILLLITLAVSFFLPRKREESHLLDDEGLPPVVMH